jgi:hypothetical protein
VSCGGGGGGVIYLHTGINVTFLLVYYFCRSKGKIYNFHFCSHLVYNTFQCFHRTTVFLHLLLSSSSPFGNEEQQFHCNIELIKSRKFSLWYVIVHPTNVVLYKTKIKKSHMKGKVTECIAALLE